MNSNLSFPENAMKRALTIALLVLSLSFAAAAQKQAPPAGGTPKPFTVPAAQHFTLPNGLKVTMVQYGQVPKVTISTIVDAGNINEGAEQVWLADLMGNLMKEGTQNRTSAQVDAAAAKMGGTLNVFVGADQTTVVGDVLSEFGPAFVKLAAEVLQKPLFPASEVERLKGDQLRNLTIAKSTPGAMANEKFRAILYPNHSYGRLYPTEAMIKSYDLAAVKKFYDDNYGAARTHVYVAGKFDAAAMKAAITGAYSAWKKGEPAKRDVPKTAGKRTLALIDRPGAAQSTVYVGLPVIDPSKPDYMALRVMNAILGGSFGSRITSNIREQKGYTYSPNSQLSARYRDTYWVEVADVTTAVTGPSLKEIFYEIDRLRKEPPSAAELGGIKNYLGGIFVLQNSSRGGVINQLVFRDLHGLGEDYLPTYVQKIRAITPEQVQQIAAKYINPDQMTIVVVGDKAKIAEQVAPYEKATAPGGN
ncbi:MAG TPA: pitrilysin family protein [Terriglobales bacterium]|nr:pitrilysin family protein [Terriglobales bacterium]